MVADTRPAPFGQQDTQDNNSPPSAGAMHAGGILDLEKSKLAGRLNQASEKIRRAVGELSEKEDSTLSRMVEKVAGSLDQAGEYVTSADPRTMVHDAGAFARRHPEIFIAGALVAGVMLGRFLRSRPPESSPADEHDHHDEAQAPVLQDPENTPW